MKRQRLDILDSNPTNLLFEDIFNIKSIDNSKFDNVSRIRGKSSGFDADIILDINTNIYPLDCKEILVIALSSFLIPASNKHTPNFSHDPINNPIDESAPLLNNYDYIMYGKIFKVEEKYSDKRSLFASFGGLLMSLTADKQVLGEIQADSRIYLLIKKSTQY